MSSNATFSNDDKKTVDDARKIKGQINDSDAPEGFFDDLGNAVEMVGDSIKGKHKIATGTAVAILAALTYVVCPIDAIPDFIPLLGFTDDAAALAIVLKSISAELDRWKKFRRRK